MKLSSLLLLPAACLIVTGCASPRSISNSSYGAAPYYAGNSNWDQPYSYRGELSEFDVLGITRGEAASEEDIQRASDSATKIRIRPNSSVLLIQSGAQFPDDPIVSELGKHFRVTPFSGIPPLVRRGNDRVPSTETRDPETFSKSLRLAAARSGSDVIVCYWGMLESANEGLATKTVSWVPVVNWIVPDERQHMRIRLKIAIIDVRSGQWAVVSPEAFDSSRVTVSPRRQVADQKLVEALKQKAYESSVRELIRLHGT